MLMTVTSQERQDIMNEISARPRCGNFTLRSDSYITIMDPIKETESAFQLNIIVPEADIIRRVTARRASAAFVTE